MAKVMTGPIIAEIRGKCGDVVFSRNRGGMFSRRVPVRVDPWSDFQIAYREISVTALEDWNAILDDAQRTAWTAAASEFQKEDQLAQHVGLTGQTLYAKINIARNFYIGETVHDVPPNFHTTNPPTITDIAAESGAQTLVVSTDRNPNAEETFIVRATNSLNEGRTYIGGKLCFAKILVDGANSPHDISDDYPDFHQPLVATKRIWIEIRTIQVQNGMIGPSTIDNAIIS